MTSGNAAERKAQASGGRRAQARSGYARGHGRPPWWAASASLTAMLASCAFPDFEVRPDSQVGGKSGAGAGGAPVVGAPAGGAPGGGKAGGSAAAPQAGEGGAGGNSAGGAANEGCTTSPDGSACETDMICSKGECVAGCWIDGSHVAPQRPNPENPCLSCDPEQSTGAWSDAPTARCVEAISAGHSHSCAVVNGAASCWGSNQLGQLGHGRGAGIIDSPVQVSGLTSGVSSIAAGTSHSCAAVNASARCWGDKLYGSLDVGDTSYPTPVQVRDIDGVSAVAAGFEHSCAIGNGLVYCWGNNRAGQLGRPPGEASGSTPVQVQNLPVSGSAVGAGREHTCALADGSVYCWGNNGAGQLGSGSDPASSGVGTVPTPPQTATPTKVLGLPAAVMASAIGENHGCALAKGAAYCWGENFDGRVGRAPAMDTTIASVVQGLDSGVSAIAAGAYHTCAIVTGSARCWGSNARGQLGNGLIDEEAQDVPVKVRGLTSGVTAIAAGLYHTCAIVNGSAQCWGENGSGQLGDGLRGLPSPIPTAVALP
ncbi:MAG TPA: hypothetical protein VER33_22215 [Polyangiaceae bacterium]|nr:hypothetical protein [Polyangiaceae bacterium]